MKEVQVKHDIGVATRLMLNSKGKHDVNFTKDGVSIATPSNRDDKQTMLTCLRASGVNIDVLKTRVKLEVETLADVANVLLVLGMLEDCVSDIKDSGDRRSFRCDVVPPLVRQFVQAYTFTTEATVQQPEPDQLTIMVGGESFTAIQVGRTFADCTVMYEDAYMDVVISSS